MDFQTLLQALYPADSAIQPTQQQQDILRHKSGPAWVLAGPGSGKTEVLSLYVMRLLFVENDPIQAERVPPECIFVTTFTEKAAKNLLDRIGRHREKILASVSNAPEVDLSKLRIGTLHSLANDILQEHRAASYRNVRLMDELETSMFVHENMSLIRKGDDARDRPFWSHFEFMMSPRDWKSTFKRLPTEWVQTRTLITLFNRVCDERKDLASMKAAGGPMARLAELYEEFQQHLIDNHRCDFSQLQYRFQQFLQSAEGQRLREGIPGDPENKGITHVLVDEYQDTNLILESIYLELGRRAPHNLIVVGDDDQSMYRFRGASVECMVTFDAACQTFWGIPPTSVAKYPLVGNFRSHPEIVSFCNDYLTAFPSMAIPGARVAGKPLMTAQGKIAGSYPAVGVMTGKKLTDIASSFADAVVDLKACGTLADYSQAVLLLGSTKESAHNAGPYVEALRSRNVPVYNPRNRKFLEQPEIAGLLGCLLLLLDPHSAHIPNWAPFELPDVLAGFRSAALSLKSSHPQLSKYIDEVNNNLATNPDVYLDAKLQELTFYLLALPPFDQAMVDAEARVRLAKLTSLIESYASIPVQNEPHVFRGTLKSNADGSGSVNPYWLKTFYVRFFGYLSRGGVNDVEDGTVISPPGMLSVMTMHQAKGLEFPVVFVGHLGDSATVEDTHTLENMFSAFPNLSGRQFNALPALVRAELDLIRKYYVAYSRAEYALVLVGTKAHVSKGTTPCGPDKTWLLNRAHEI
ncbi:MULTISPECIES: DEAD/DEAH box helicase [Stenotrophomonas]|uniref:UvrD-helicase domain-containing protein n=1 Tax=Stenotrophomonas TaxID=40323 RepID=UPI001304644C|nr:MULTISPECIES: DEAD/DEAH box helicase [Stenotrophomonas]